uniref:Reverse transcriptase domain-containing protein n=1 Tax=Oryzias sinensis TaxID=183150 RepID=A0A8C7WRW4_9TELE
MQNNFLQLNSNKTEVIIFGPHKQRESVSSYLHSLSLKPSNQVRNLGVIMDSDLNFNSHIKSVTSAAFYHLKNISKIKNIVSKPDLEILIHAFVSSRLDYCNGLLTGLSKRAVKQLQYIQNAAARVLTRTRKYDHISPVLRSLHWLPVPQRIDFKAALLVYKSLHGRAPKYISDMLVPYEPCNKKNRTLHFSNLILQNKNDPRVLFKTIDSLTKIDSQRSSIAALDAVCESFADHFRSKINAIGSSLLTQKGVDFNESIALHLSEKTLESFVLVDAVGLGQVFSQLKPTTCLLDSIPTSLLKTFYDFFEFELLNIVNYSLQTGIFPAAFKTPVVRPLLKKSNLDPNNYNNYRPVSNLPFLSKMIEKTVLIQFHEFLNINNIFEKYPSGFRTNHSTVTALVKIVNDIRCNLKCQILSVLVLPDLSAAFDTVDHSTLLNRLRGLSISATILKWFYSYLTDQSFYVSMDTCSSKVFDIICGVPQGSILGPLLFNLYMLPLGDVIRRHGVCFHSYADEESVNTLLKCILDIKSWMAENFLQLNHDKTEVLVISSEDKKEIVLSKLKNYKTSQCVRNLGFIFYSEMNFIPQIKNITKTGFYHLKNIIRVRPFLSLASTEVLMLLLLPADQIIANPALWSSQNKDSKSSTTAKFSSKRVDEDQGARTHYTGLRIAALAPCAIQNGF